MTPFFTYQGYLYFFDLLCLSLLLLPCYYALRSVRARRILMIFAGMYLVYFIAPRLALFYLLFWSVIFLLHRFAFRDDEQQKSGQRRFYMLFTLLLTFLPLVLWKRMDGDFTAPSSFYSNIYFIAPQLALFYLLFWLFISFLHRFAFRDGEDQNGDQQRRFYMLLTLSLTVLPLVLWKRLGEDFAYPFSFYTNEFLELLSGKLWQIDLCRNIIGPLGLSFATFRAVDLLVKTSLGQLTGLAYDEVLFYGFFPPVQLVGPIIEYGEIADQSSRPDPRAFLDGLLRIGFGFIKIFVLAGLLAGNEKIFDKPADFHAGELWLRLAGYSWYFYLNFSGYSDIAIGAARLFGFTLRENFDFPYFKPDLQAFWNSWHMSLSRWAQRNIFIPCGGYRPETQYTALFLTMLAIAMWHNINAAMAVFAAVQFGALALHRHRMGKLAAPGLSPERRAAANPVRTGSYMLLTYLTVMLCFPLIALDLKKALVFYAVLIGVGP